MNSNLKNFIEGILKKEQNDTICIVGKNASGKTECLKHIRDYVYNNELKGEYQYKTLHFDVPNYQVFIREELRLGRYAFEKIIANLLDQNDIDCNSKWLEDRNIIKHVNDRLSVFIDDVKVSFQIDTEKGGEGKQINFYITFTTNGRNNTKTLRYSPCGFRVLIPILFHVELISNIVLTTDQKIKFLYLLDEPETNLHPEWQTKLSSYLFEKNQETNALLNIIYATHSPYMIPTSKLNSIKLTEFKNNEIEISSVIDLMTVNQREISPLKPIEYALGFEFDIFFTPFLTVEGEQEMQLLYILYQKLQQSIPPKTINLQGSSKLPPYLLLAQQHKNKGKLKSVFMLDLDVNIQTDWTGLENKDEIIKDLKDHFIFIGKEIYTFDEIYNYNNGKFKKISERNECLEDFLANKIFKGYEPLKEIALKYFKDNLSVRLNETNYTNCVTGQMSTKSYFKPIISCIKNDGCVTPSLSNREYKTISDEIKTLILQEALVIISNNHSILSEFKLLIDKINSIML